MKTLDDLRKFYDTSLIASLQELEGTRKKIVNNMVYWMGGACILVAVLVIFASNPGMLILLPFLLLAIYGVVFYTSGKSYTADFKARVIKEIVKFIDPGLDYESDRFIPQEVYAASEIFKITPDRYNGKDYVSGKLGATQTEFSEIDSQYKTESTDSQGRIHTEWHTIFKGIFFAADFNKDFHGRTVVLPDTAEKLFGFLGTALQSMNITRGQLIKLEDPEFEKLFVVYGDDQVESRYVLSTSLMKRITDFKNKSGRKVFLSFVRSKIFVAIEYTQDIFEPRLFKTLLDFAPIQQYFEHFELVLGLVDDLNLNTRIWSKQ
jgi:hypothetical protein